MSSKILQATVTTADVEALPLVEIAERLIYDDTALNAVCDKMIEAAQRILSRDLHAEDAWQQAERDLSAEQRLAVWLEAISSIS